MKLTKQTLIAITIIMLFILSACSNIEYTQNINVDGAIKLINTNKENENFVILDVRTPQEYAQGHIKDSILIDFYSPTFKEELSKLDKDKTYLIYCRSGSRSRVTLGLMNQLEFHKVYNLENGFNSWKSKNKPIETNK